MAGFISLHRTALHLGVRPLSMIKKKTHLTTPPNKNYTGALTHLSCLRGSRNPFRRQAVHLSAVLYLSLNALRRHTPLWYGARPPDRYSSRWSVNEFVRDRLEKNAAAASFQSRSASRGRVALSRTRTSGFWRADEWVLCVDAEHGLQLLSIYLFFSIRGKFIVQTWRVRSFFVCPFKTIRCSTL